MNPYFLLGIGLLLIFLEFYLPGAIMGTVGAVLVVISVVVFAMESSSTGATILFFMVSLASVAAVIYLALWQIRRTGSKNTLFLKSDQTGFQASSFDASAVEKMASLLQILSQGDIFYWKAKNTKPSLCRAIYPKAHTSM